MVMNQEKIPIGARGNCFHFRKLSIVTLVCKLGLMEVLTPLNSAKSLERLLHDEVVQDLRGVPEQPVRRIVADKVALPNFLSKVVYYGRSLVAKARASRDPRKWIAEVIYKIYKFRVSPVTLFNS